MTGNHESTWKPLPALLPEQAHLWYCDVDASYAPSVLDAYADMLDEGERGRLARRRGAQLKQRFLVSHALLRSVLSLYVDRPPASWRFREGKHGKPELEPQQAGGTPSFNLSHSGSAALVAIVADPTELGVDIELHNPGRRLEALARRNFSALEYAQLMRCTGASRSERFFDLWALKESFIKARGEGLALPLQQFAFNFEDRNGCFGFEPDGVLGEQARDWCFWSYRIPGPYSAALAWRTRSVLQPLEPLYMDAVPLLRWRYGTCISQARSLQITAI